MLRVLHQWGRLSIALKGIAAAIDAPLTDWLVSLSTCLFGQMNVKAIFLLTLLLQYASLGCAPWELWKCRVFFTNCLSKSFLWFCLNKNLEIFKLVDCRLAQYNENLIIETEIHRTLQIWNSCGLIDYLYLVNWHFCGLGFMGSFRVQIFFDPQSFALNSLLNSTGLLNANGFCGFVEC
jgi:hypothetical protein